MREPTLSAEASGSLVEGNLSLRFFPRPRSVFFIRQKLIDTMNLPGKLTPFILKPKIIMAPLQLLVFRLKTG
jgi:hypothetical protein